jgi:hypothetical protein
MSDDFEFEPTKDLTVYSDKQLTSLMKAEERALAKVERAEASEEMSDADKDFEEVRDNIKDLIDKGTPLLDDMISLAKASDNARAFEVASNLMRNMIEANKDILDIHERKRKIETFKFDPVIPPQQQSTEGGGNTTTNNIVFAGSTREMAEFAKNNYKVVDNDGDEG